MRDVLLAISRCRWLSFRLLYTTARVRSSPHALALGTLRGDQMLVTARYLLQTCASGESTWKNNCDNTGGEWCLAAQVFDM